VKNEHGVTLLTSDFKG